MQRIFYLNNRSLIFSVQRARNHDFTQTNRPVRMGLPFSFDEKQALDYFNRWRRSFWLAPSDWQQMTVTMTRRFVPFWSFSFKGSVSAEAYVNRGAWIWGGDEWHRLNERVTLNNLDLKDIQVYAAHNYDRQHIVEIDMKKNESPQPLENLPMFNEDSIDDWTIDRDTAFEIGWDMTVVNMLQDLCIEALNRQKKGKYRITSVRFPIKEETQELIYLPIYVVDYQYRDRQLQCLINGRTGKVAGLRQFSQLKTSAFLLAFAYPICVTSIISILSFAFYNFSGRIAVIPIALLVTGVTLAPTIFGTLQIGRYVRDFSHLYRNKRDLREWLEFKKQNPYRFTERNYGDQDGSASFQREQTRETRKPTYSFNMDHDLYGVLGVSRAASNAIIKQAYLLKAKEFHPDRNVGNKDVEEKFKLINHAYAILSDPEQRQIFDEYGYDHVKYK